MVICFCGLSRQFLLGPHAACKTSFTFLILEQKTHLK
uniref:Uncharacterized protein n=1 Tax=Rhizophora mucronata TaxID=61149 RepID=A0A2P2QJL0_RHIMU